MSSLQEKRNKQIALAAATITTCRMIKKNEIRIGNVFLWSDEKEWIVDENNIKISIAAAHNHLLKGITITSELLEQKGFKPDTKQNRYFLNHQYRFVLYKVVKTFFLCEQNSFDTGFHEIRSVEAFHQLQNLYFDLTGEELKVKKPVVT